MHRTVLNLLILSIALVTSTVCSAAILNVPADFSTIQAGIDAAVDGDTVLVADGTYTGDGNRDIDFTGKEITLISKNGPELCVINCEGSETENHRGFFFQTGEDHGSVLEGVTIRNGFDEYNGGGIFCYYSSPTIRDCIIAENISGGSGGGIACWDSDTVIQNCIFSNNHAYHAGAIQCARSNLELLDCYITDNSAEASFGGICSTSGPSSLLVSNCIISGNTANLSGGFLGGFDSSLTFANCTISNNSAGIDGGGIACYNSDLILTGSDILNNCAGEAGGGVYLWNSIATIGGTEEDENYFSGNSALAGLDILCKRIPSQIVDATHNRFSGYHLSDYYVSPPAAFDLTSCESELIPATEDLYVSTMGNDSNDGLSWDTSFKTIHHALSIIGASENNPLTVYLGEGIFSPSITGETFPLPLLNHVSIEGIRADGSILDAENSDRLFIGYCDDQVTISNVTIKNGRSIDGGGICLRYSSPIIERNIISMNIAERLGGGILCDIYSSPIIRNCSVVENSADSGGGISCEDYAAPLIENCSISNNNAEGIGGIRCGNYSSPRIVGCIVSSNHSNFPSGGIGCASYSETIIEDSVITSNSSMMYGGGITCGGISSLTLSNSVISYNYALKDGGGLHFKTSAPRINNCLINGNSAENGGAFFCSSLAEPVLTNCTIVDNTATQNGGGITCENDSNPFISNCILWSNIPDEISTISGNPVVIFTDIMGGFPGDGNINEDPKLTDGPLGAFYLSHIDAGQTVDSPCIGAGNDSAADVCFDMMSGQICLDTFTTRTDLVSDTEIVDMGFHYRRKTSWCEKTGVTLWMPRRIFNPGDFCELTAYVCNKEFYDLNENPLFVILDVYGYYWFAPGWSENMDYFEHSFPVDGTVIQVIDKFVWPEGFGNVEGIFFYAALTDPEMTELVGEMGVFDFGWNE